LQENVGIIICDSIAANVRVEFGKESLSERQQALSKQASVLKFLAETFAIPVLVVRVAFHTLLVLFLLLLLLQNARL